MDIKSMDRYGAGAESGNLQSGINKFMLAALLGAALSMNVNAQNNARVGRNFADGRNFDLGGTEQGRNFADGRNFDGNELGKSNSIPLNLNNYEPVFDNGEIGENKSDFIELALKMGLDLYSLFPEGLDSGKYDELFRYPLDIIIDEAVKLARVHGCFYTVRQFGVVEMLCSFWNNGKLDLDENHSIDLSVFPGVDMNDLNLNDISFCDGGILLPYHDFDSGIDGIYRLGNFGFLNDSYFYGTCKSWKKFVNARDLDAWAAAIDFGKCFSRLNSLCEKDENDNSGEAGTPEKKQALDDVREAIYKASILFNFTPEQRRFLEACVNGNLLIIPGALAISYVDDTGNLSKTCYVFDEVVDLDELKQLGKTGYDFVWMSKNLGDIPWIIRDGKLDWVVPKNSKSSLEDSIYNGRLDVAIENPSDGYDGLEGSSGSIILDEVVKNPGEGIIHNHK